jgi:hypothetical protein
MGRTFLGEFEQRVLLTILRCGENARAFGSAARTGVAQARPVEIRRELERISGQEISRGAFYTTLDRLEGKDLIKWTEIQGGATRDGLPDRRLDVTPSGVSALKASRKTLLELWSGLEWILE